MNIVTLDAVYAKIGLAASEAIPYADPIGLLQRRINASANAFCISAAYNDGWKPDFSNEFEMKHSIWWVIVDGNIVFKTVSHVNRETNIPLGMTFKSWDLAEAAAMNFYDVYRDLIL